MKRKTITRIGIAAVLLVGLTVGSALAQAPVTIDFWGGWTGPDRGVMENLVNHFQAQNPGVKVNLFTVQWTPLFDRFLTSFRSGEVPDVLAMHVQDIATFAGRNLLQPVAKDVANAGIKADQFAQTAWDGTFWGGTQYAFPLDLHMHAIYVNVDMFKAAGLDPGKLPTTGAELIADATKLTLDQNGKHPGENGFDPTKVKQWGYGMNSNHHGFYYFYALLAQQGASFLDPAGTKVVVDTVKGERAWQWLQDLVYKYKIVPPGETNAFQDWVTGRVAMAVDGPWQLPAAQQSATFAWTTTTFPNVFGRPATWGSGHVLTLPVKNDPAKRQAATKFITWLLNNSAGWGTSGNIPAMLAARQTQEFKSLPGRTAFVNSLPFVVFLPDIPKTNQVFSAAGPSPIVVAAQSVILKDAPVSQVLKQLIEGANQILATP
jgi:multiple sugar transport system substrate-binding protein